MRTGLQRSGGFFGMVMIGLALAPATLGGQVRSQPTSPAWAEVKRLTDEQKLQAALDRLTPMLAQAKKSGDEMEVAKILAESTKLQTGLHGYETAVKNLRGIAWPREPLARALVGIFYAQGLMDYERAYSWEIRKREKIESKTELDLKAWTSEQILREAARSYEEIWREREKLGAHKRDVLQDFVQPNTYPENVRGTFRDTLSHLIVAMLSDTAGWTPAQSNEIHTLNLSTLLTQPELRLTEPSVHPIAKLAGVLRDLELWHRKAGRKEAALDARIELITRLHERFTSSEDREMLRSDLTRAIESAKNLPWSSMGLATLADLVRQEGSPDNLVRARKIAQEGADAFPKSPGASRCRDILSDIDQPSYSLEAMRVDAPGKRSLGVQYKNLKRLYFRSYAYDLVRHLEEHKDYDHWLGYREFEKILGSPIAKQWQLDLPATPDFKTHRQYITPPEHKPGFYVIVASAKPDFSNEDNVILGVQAIFGKAVLIHRPFTDSGRIEAEVVLGADGKALAGASVRLFRKDYGKGPVLIGTRKTDKNGLASFEAGMLDRILKTFSGQLFMIAEHEGEFAASSSPFYFYKEGEPKTTSGTFVYTDRSVYRPGQKIRWKVVAYSGSVVEGRYHTSGGKSLSVEIRDANHQVVGNSTVSTDRFGAAAGEFEIPSGKLLGQWTVRVTTGGQASVRVEEYKRPTFEVKISDPKSPLRLNQKAVLSGEARYHFGLPLSNGKIHWTIHRTLRLPWWCFWGGWGFGDWDGGQKEQLVSSGNSVVAKDGTFEVSFLPKADERSLKAARDLHYDYRIQADVTDEGGETRGAQRSFPIGAIAVSAGIQLNEGFLLENSEVAVSISRTALNGSPLAGTGKWTLHRVREPETTLPPADQPPPSFLGEFAKLGYKTPDDQRLSRWNPSYNPDLVLRGWEDGETVSQGSLSHGADGKAQLKLATLRAGVYRLKYETLDAFGTKFETQKEFLVSGERSRFSLPGFFALENPSVTVGGKARLLAASGFSGQRMVLEVYRSGSLLERRELVSGATPSVLEFPITEKDRGGLAFTLRVLNDYQEMRFTRQLMVPWDNQELKVSFSTFRDKMRPGAKEKWTVHLSGPGGSKVTEGAAQVLAYMYDRSLDYFSPHYTPDPRSIYPYRANAREFSADLGSAPGAHFSSQGFRYQHEYSGFSVDRVVHESGYGIGGPGMRARRGFGLAESDQMSPAAAPMMSLKTARNEMADASAGAAPAEAEKSSLAESKEEKQKDSRGDSDKAPGSAPDSAPPVELRSRFDETAFWYPQLLSRVDGSVDLEFTVPDSVTSWNVWVHALTQDLKSGSLSKEARSVKELMIRPYLPRFFREGDKASIKVVVNNASDKALSGRVELDVLDPATQKSLLKEFGVSAASALGMAFDAPALGSATVSIPLKVPARVGPVAFKAIARSGDYSDGELRPLPVLPGRFHLAQSRFVTLKDKDSRKITFEDLTRGGDDTRIHEQLVVTLDAQLFYSVLSALPYLVNSPYECTEQTLNRFVSTGILGSLYKDYPAVAKMAREFSKRPTRLERFDQADPNRKMAMEETPWLVASQGGKESPDELYNVLDPGVTSATREEALVKLRKAQTALGGFPWFPGGPPSPYMTLYLLHGFSKAVEFGVDVPKDMVKKAWGYLHRHYLDELVREAMAHDCCWETVTFLNYVLSNFPKEHASSWGTDLFTEAERKRMLDFAFKHWKQHAPYLKGYLTLTLLRAERRTDARLVWESVMDSAKTAQDEGTHWAAEDRSWLWYNDTIETHAFAVRTEMEIKTSPAKLDGMVLWLLLNKKLNHWKSTRATAEVVYSLARYLKDSGQLGVKEEAQVKLGNVQTHRFEFDPEQYTGKKNQIVISGDKVNPSLLPITVDKTTPGHLFASATWQFSTEKLPEEARGDFLSVTRAYFKRVQAGGESKLLPLSEGAEVQLGDEIEVQLSLRSKHPLEYVHLRDPRPAGFEPETKVSGYKWNLGIGWYEEVRDSGANFFLDRLPQGEFTFKYRIRAATAGNFKAFPATVQPMYAPEFAAYSSGTRIRVAGP